MEIWKDVKGYEGFYQVSTYGNVKRLKSKIKSKAGSIATCRERILKSGVGKSGYSQVVLCVNHKRKTFTVHRLVASTFIKNPKRKKTINHKDGIKINNDVNNLEWATQSENIIHSLNNNLAKPVCGENHGNSKLNDLQVRIIRRLNGHMSQREISEYFNISQANAKDIIKKRTWKHI